jgi:hypothetical protein
MGERRRRELLGLVTTMITHTEEERAVHEKAMEEMNLVRAARKLPAWKWREFTEKVFAAGVRVLQAEIARERRTAKLVLSPQEAAEEVEHRR